MVHPNTLTLAACVVASSLATTAVAQDDHAALRSWMSAIVENGDVVGCMAQITHDGETKFLEAYGAFSPDSDRELTTDDVVRIYSMTKPITSVAAMIAVEEGLIDLEDPVSKYIPAFEHIKVGWWPDGEEPRGDTMRLRPPSRPVIIFDLLTHTSGLGYGFSVSEAFQPAYQMTPWMTAGSLEAFVDGLAALPLVHDPGEDFTYGLGVDVVGRIVEIVTKTPFDKYLDARIFEPLKMRDTGFRPDDGVEPMPICTPGESGALQVDAKHYVEEAAHVDPHLPLGGGGLYSTLEDYSRFCTMIANRGELDGVRILEPDTVEFMMTNQLGPAREGDAGSLGLGARFGIGFGIQEPVKTTHGPRGGDRVTWGGAASTNFFIDPRQKTSAVFYTQKFPFDFSLNDAFQMAALQAIADEMKADSQRVPKNSP